jgi:hypothetical protein
MNDELSSVSLNVSTIERTLLLKELLPIVSKRVEVVVEMNKFLVDEAINL